MVRRAFAGVERPEAARHGIIPAVHCHARLRLANRAVDLIRSARAGAASTGDFIPVNGIILGETTCQKQQAEKQKESFHKRLISFPRWFAPASLVPPGFVSGLGFPPPAPLS